jgi:hypothetical protein
MSGTSPGLAPDEKLCPYCAETIKAAAVKCRFCQSDLVAEPATAAAVEPVEPVEETAPEIAPGEVDAGHDVPEATYPVTDPGPDHWPGAGDLGDDPSDRAGGTLLKVAMALLVLCLVLGGSLYYLADRAQHPELGVAPNGQVTDNSFRNAAMSTASDTATQMLSYTWKTFDEDRAKARKLLTGKAASQYEQAMDEVKDKAATARLTLTANALSVGTISVKEHSAKLLLFVNTYTTREGSKKQQFQQSRLVMEMTRKNGDWIVSDMDTV